MYDGYKKGKKSDGIDMKKEEGEGNISRLIRQENAKKKENK
jgi:hypothetical protein